MRVTLEQAIDKLQQGEVVAIPTETVYGLAADASNDAALQQIYAIKQRPANNPLIVHIASSQQVLNWAAEFPPLAQKMAAVFWPGPFTLVLPAQPQVSSIVRAGEPTIALRVPAHPLTLALLQQSGLSLAAPSANQYTQLSPTSAAHVEAGLGTEIPVLDGGACQVGIESTIVSVQDNDWQLLRHGMITEAAIAAITGKAALTTPSHTPKAPGQHLLHYSPRTPTQLFTNHTALMQYASEHPHCAALLFGEGTHPACEYLQLPQQPALAAEALYDALHQLDGLGKSEILIALPPAQPEWAAITDRLTRAGYRAEHHT